MFSQRGCIVQETADGWRVAVAGDRSSQPVAQQIEATAPEEIADAVVAFVDEHRLRRDRVLVAPGSCSAVFVTFPAADLAGARDRRTMAFRLEGSLPFDAEQIVADYQIGPQQVSGVAVRCDDLLPLVEALEERDLLLTSIVPANLLACQSLATRSPHVNNGFVLWQEDDRIELFQLAGGQLHQWRHLPATTTAIRRELAMNQLYADDDPAVTLVNVTEEIADAVSASINARRITSDGLDTHARRFAGDVVAGRQTPWFELRRDRLACDAPNRAYSRSLSWLTAAAVAFVIALAVAGWGRATQLQQRHAAIKEQQRELFEQAFPGAKVPRAIVSRIESEHARMLASRQTTGEVPESLPALDVLHGYLRARHDLMSRPDEVRSRTTSLRIENGDLTTDLELRSHDDAGQVAAALEEAGFTVEPPTTTQRDDKTVVTKLRAQWSSGSDKDGESDANKVAGRVPTETASHREGDSR